MTITDWLWIIHPALAVVLIYPLIGMVVRLALQTRQSRVAKVKHPPVVGHDHSVLGRWLAASVVLLVLFALTGSSRPRRHQLISQAALVVPSS